MKPDLDAIRARCEAATPGPWASKRYSSPHDGFLIQYRAHKGETETVADIPLTSDAELFAAARTDIPALLAYIDELERRMTYTIGETEWAHRIAVAEQRFVDEYDARKAAEREIAELQARIAVLEAMKP